MALPTPERILELHRLEAPSEHLFQLVYTHCTIVAALAHQLIAARSLKVDEQLVAAGCMLHDIGVYRVLDANGHSRPDRPYITHGLEGEAILRQAFLRRSGAWLHTILV